MVKRLAARDSVTGLLRAVLWAGQVVGRLAEPDAGHSDLPITYLAYAARLPVKRLNFLCPQFCDANCCLGRLLAVHHWRC